MVLMSVNDTSYYSEFSCSYESKVVQGKFRFAGSLLYPTAFRAGFKVDSNWASISDIFFIDSGYQTISCNIDSLREIPAISNWSMTELTGHFLPAFIAIGKMQDDYYNFRRLLRQKYAKGIPERLIDSLNEIKNNLEYRGDSVLETYIKLNPQSYVALWEVIAEFSSGYKKTLDSIFRCFSPNLRKSSTGLVFAQRLESAKIACIGCRFPKASLARLEDSGRKSPLSAVFSKYTLIDFWFSHCTPCIEQFPNYSRIYEAYNGLGFQIVGISTDKRSQINDWRAVILAHGLKWPQFLDADGLFARQLSISMWPSNFLLDEKGLVVMRNIDPEQLEKFLKANLK
jgi:thiol-disulfide isomerase/thioredoxin